MHAAASDHKLAVCRGNRRSRLAPDVDTVEPGFVDPLIILIGPDGKALIGDDDISRSEYDAVISDYRLQSSGQYTLVLSHAEGGANGTLHVDVDVTPMSRGYGYDHDCLGGGR